MARYWPDSGWRSSVKRVRFRDRRREQSVKNFEINAGRSESWRQIRRARARPLDRSEHLGVVHLDMDRIGHQISGSSSMPLGSGYIIGE